MSLTKLTDNLNNIQALPDKPTDNAQTLKQKFDKAGNDIKTYINQVLTAEVDALISNIQSEKIAVSKIVNNFTTGGATNVASAETVKQLNDNKINTSSIYVINESFLTVANTHMATFYCNYPEGFNANNCVVIALGVATDLSQSNKYYYDNEVFSEHQVGAMLGSSITVALCRPRATFSDGEHIPFRLVLMKIS